jgi:hypothetical protein
MRRELEEELKNECFLAQMKINRLNDMEDFFHNEDWCYENDENGNMIFFIYNIMYDEEYVIESINNIINQFGDFQISEYNNYWGERFMKLKTTLPFVLFRNEFF